MKIIFQIEGGIGKSIAGTAVCKAVRAQCPNDELIVITGYPEVFLGSGIKVFGFNELRYFYEQYVLNQEKKIIAHNPYLDTAFIEGKTHLIQVWNEMHGIRYNGELPELSINNREQEFYTNVFAGQGMFDSGKPLMVMQTNGGGRDQPNKYSWTRDLPIATAQKVVDHFAKDYTIIHIRREDQLQLKNVTPVTTDFRAMAVLIKFSEKRLLIDSCLQHAAAALGKPSVVCMIDQLTLTHFGYDMHTNIIANPPTNKLELRHAVYSPFNISGIPLEFPYNNVSEIYGVEEIIEALEKTPKKDEPVKVADETLAATNGTKKKDKLQPVES